MPYRNNASVGTMVSDATVPERREGDAHLFAEARDRLGGDGQGGVLHVRPCCLESHRVLQQNLHTHQKLIDLKNVPY